MILIGDVHGKTEQHHKIIKENPNEYTIQLGDFGFKKEHDWFLNNIDSSKNKILFGNHDYYPYLYKDHSIHKFSYAIEGIDYLCIRGAASIDVFRRIEGVDYFHEEELTYKEGYELLEAINIIQNTFREFFNPIVISHDCPQFIVEEVFNIKDKSLTRQLLEIVYKQVKPDKWIFGHHHKSIQYKFENTEFICLKELETYKL